MDIAYCNCVQLDVMNQIIQMKVGKYKKVGKFFFLSVWRVGTDLYIVNLIPYPFIKRALCIHGKFKVLLEKMRKQLNRVMETD